MHSQATVLVVEDDPTSRYLLANLLKDMGYAVTSAATGDEGLDYLYSDAVCDVTLVDVVMPGMSGVEFIRRSRDARPSLPSILMTGRQDGLRLALDSGAVALIKPIERQRLSAVLIASIWGAEPR